MAAPGALQVVDHVLAERDGVGADTVNEARIAAAKKMEADDVEPRRRGHAAVMLDLAAPVDDRHAQPAIVASESGRPDDRLDAGRVEIQVVEHSRGRRPIRLREQNIDGNGGGAIAFHSDPMMYGEFTSPCSNATRTSSITFGIMYCPCPMPAIGLATLAQGLRSSESMNGSRTCTLPSVIGSRTLITSPTTTP